MKDCRSYEDAVIIRDRAYKAMLDENYSVEQRAEFLQIFTEAVKRIAEIMG